MKKYYFVLVLIFLVNLLSAQTIPSYVPKDGLIGWWPFNGNANDESGNGNNGEEINVNYNQDRNHENNKSLELNGNSYVKISNSQLFQNLNNKLTICGWFKPANFFNNEWYSIICKSNTFGPLQFNIQAFPTGINFLNNGVAYQYLKTINLNSWYFFAVVQNESTVTFFLNESSFTLTSPANYNYTYSTNNNIEIGRDEYGGLEYANGLTDDIAIYNRALTEQEVQGLYTGSPCANPIAQVFQPTCFLKTGQIQLKAYTGNEYSYSLDGKNYTADTMFRELAPGAYTVFVKHTSGCMDSTSVTIQPVPTSLTATTSQVGSVKICAESSMLVSAIAGRNYTYQWYKDNTLLQDSISKNLTISKAGKYSVFVSDGACSDTSDYLVLDTIPLPDAPILNTNYIRICDKYNTYLQNIIQMNQINPSYRWYPLETGTDSLSKQSWLPIPYGSGIQMPYYLSQFSATNPACESKKRTMLMVADKTPPNINYISNTTLCPGDSIELQVNNGAYPWELAWNKDWMQVPNSQGKTSIFVKEAGNYSVYNTQCMNNYIQGENSIQIDMQTVSIQEFSNYVLKNEAPIPLVGNPVGGVFSGAGVKDSVFDPSALKLGKTRIKYNYVSPSGCAGEALKEVIVVDSSGTGGCTQIKYDTVTVKNNVYDTILKIQFKLTTGVKANQLATMSLYPNPTSDVLIIDLADIEALKEYRYRIFDLSGKEVYNAPVTDSKTEISLKSLGAKGMYVLHIIDENNTSIATKQIVLE